MIGIAIKENASLNRQSTMSRSCLGWKRISRLEARIEENEFIRLGDTVKNSKGLFNAELNAFTGLQPIFIVSRQTIPTGMVT